MHRNKSQFTLILYILTINIYISGNTHAESTNHENFPANNNNLTGDIRRYQQGDVFRYASNITRTTTITPTLVTQSIDKVVINPQGKHCLEHTLTTTFPDNPNLAAFDTKLLFYQDSNNSIYECGFYDEKNAQYVFIFETENTSDSVALTLHSPLQLGNTTSSLISYTDGSWKDCTRTVQSTETLNTSVGRYASYKISENCSNNKNNSNTNTMIWFVPALFTVRETGTGDEISGEFTLESYFLK